MRDKVIHIASVGYELPYKLTLFNNLSNKIMPKKRRQNGKNGKPMERLTYKLVKE